MGLVSWTSLLWLLLLAPLIVLLYLLKLKRRPVAVSSVLLWSRLLQDVQANSPFQKLRRNLLLLLQLLTLFLAIFALARPFVRTNALRGKSVVVILDGSASMQSRDVEGGTRFDAARRTALRMVDAMQAGDQMMALLVTSRPERLAAFTADRGQLRRALQAARPGDTTSDLREAIMMAATAAGSSPQRQGNQIFVLSDGAVPADEEIDPRGSSLEFVRFGTRARNAGIVAFDARRKPDGGYQAFIAVRQHAREPLRANLELYRDDNLFDVRPVNLPAADPELGYSEQALVIDDLAVGSGILRARLDAADDLPVDNQAFAELSASREIRVLLVTAGNVFLQKALETTPEVKLALLTTAAYTGQAGYDVVVFDSAPPAKVGPGNTLYLNCGGPNAPVDLLGPGGETTIVDWSRAHPVLRYVNLQGLDIRQAWRAKVRPWAQELASHGDGVVIAAGERQDGADGGLYRSLYLGFSPLESDFWQRVGFPIFIGNAVQWLAAPPGSAPGERLATGEVAVVALPEGVRSATVTRPDGKRETVRAEGPLLLFRDTGSAGVYQVEGPNRFRTRFVANLLSRAESNTQPRDSLRFGRRPVTAMGTGRTAPLEIWRWLAVAALAILAVEWVVYHRRL